MRSILGDFTAKTSSGKTVRVRMFQHWLEVPGPGGGIEQVEGLKEMLTTDGHSVNYVSKGNYRIVQTGEEITSTDENAP